MTVEPRFVEQPTVSYVGARERLNRTHLAQAVPRLLAGASHFLRHQSIAPTGPPLVRYLVVDYHTGDVEIEAGFPVAALPAARASDVRVGELPAGRYATVVHLGSYSTLVDTTASLLDWAKQSHVSWQMIEEGKVTRWAARVEHYDVGPPAESDPNNWRTTIAILLAH